MSKTGTKTETRRPQTSGGTRRKEGFLHKVYRYRVFLLMLLPAVILVFVFSYIPMAGAVIAFKKYNYQLGIFKSPWNGIDNFRFFFRSGKALMITRNTALYNIAFIVTTTILEVFFAVVLNEMTFQKLKKFTQSVIFLPYFISWVIVGSIAYSLFNYETGTLNSIREALGQSRINFYGNGAYWPGIIIFFNAWKSVGYGMVVYLAAIVGIDGSLMEAAEIDGANIFQRVRYITLPELRPTVVTLTLLALGRIFRGNLDLFYQLVGQNGTLFNYTDVIDTYVFRLTLKASDAGQTVAVGLYQSVLCFITIMIANGIVKKLEPDYSLF